MKKSTLELHTIQQPNPVYQSLLHEHDEILSDLSNVTARMNQNAHMIHSEILDQKGLLDHLEHGLDDELLHMNKVIKSIAKTLGISTFQQLRIIVILVILALILIILLCL